MIELNKIYCENCLDTMARMPDNFVDLTVTSPPYDNLRQYKGYSFDCESVAKELFRVTKQGGVIVWVVGDATINGSETGTSFRQALYFKEIGFNLHDTMIYKTNKPPLSHNRYEQGFEFMFVFSKGSPKAFNPIMEKCKYFGESLNRKETTKGSRGQNSAFRSRPNNKTVKEEKIKFNVWEYKSGGHHTTSDEIAFEHPAIYPEKLVADHIHSWSNKGDLVYDPFSGSGTTAKMAHIYARDWIGSEISREYVELANKRLDGYLRQTKLF